MDAQALKPRLRGNDLNINFSNAECGVVMNQILKQAAISCAPASDFYLVGITTLESLVKALNSIGRFKNEDDEALDYCFEWERSQCKDFHERHELLHVEILKEGQDDWVNKEVLEGRFKTVCRWYYKNKVEKILEE